MGAALFDTAIGSVGVAWRGDAVTAIRLPEHSQGATLRRLTGSSAAEAVDDPPPPIAEAMAAMRSLLEGEPVDLGFVAVDLAAAPAFDRSVYEVTRSIPAGRWLTYGQVAERSGQPGAAQAVGRALAANPVPIIVPCHRVLGAGGDLVGFSARGGVATKRRMLLIEGCPAVAPSLFDLVDGGQARQ